MNKVVISGRMAADPEQRDTSTGTPLTAFVVAVPRSYAPKGKERETDFIYCKAFNHTAEFILQRFAKGNPIEVEGSIQVRKYQDADGKNKSVMELIVSSVGFVPSGPREEKTEEKTVDEIPF